MSPACALPESSSMLAEDDGGRKAPVLVEAAVKGDGSACEEAPVVEVSLDTAAAAAAEVVL